ncbi:DUF397 domain-containing protein [Streptomyces sp. NPDC002537]
MNPFKKSSYSGNIENCVEVTYPEAPGPVSIRDSKNPTTGPQLRVTPTAYRSFTRAVRDGDLRSRTR